ncbi:EAL domain-containing protein (putative c-di-GMP-specific phosphodiesterase class I) [Bacillus ectoiniformans]|uniref:EAL domain-containing protein n=1 Tax=Bacillus ectoiniformans TaxID=1494429 RepID=UPI001956C636|nr:EAL-associated domain-containing protein [Bacillus ectoiniformans]MBM7647302.1 EAL domain-containing protein (putative c-di-GMP-specific phosphodiesterase class I) [Bacillus ectoiniformans]
MDALEVMSHLDQVMPAFQPIFSADEHRIIGYEVLGRFKDGEEIKSLGPFFEDEEVPEEYHLEVDCLLISKALDLYTDSNEQAMLFINCTAAILMKEDGEFFLQLLKSYESKGFKLEKVVLEISERDYRTNLEHLIRYYKTLGIRIAIDHLSENNANIHRLSGCAPDILKVNLDMLRSESANHNYNDFLYSLSMLARKIGASLLFESIEVEYQLQYAWKHGGRYYQGFYLEKPDLSFKPSEIMREKLRRKCQEFILHEKRSLEKVYMLAESIQNEIQTVVSRVMKQHDSKEYLLEELGKKFEMMCFRLYICDENGFELTPNYFKKSGEWIFQPEYFDKNWSWRPYFLENILKMRKNKRGLISDLYSDIETGELTRTFSYPLNEHEYLFMDISYEFLFEQDGLLY